MVYFLSQILIIAFTFSTYWQSCQYRTSHNSSHVLAPGLHISVLLFLPSFLLFVVWHFSYKLAMLLFFHCLKFPFLSSLLNSTLSFVFSISITSVFLHTQWTFILYSLHTTLSCFLHSLYIPRNSWASYHSWHTNPINVTLWVQCPMNSHSLPCLFVELFQLYR